MRVTVTVNSGSPEDIAAAAVAAVYPAVCAAIAKANAPKPSWMHAMESLAKLFRSIAWSLKNGGAKRFAAIFRAEHESFSKTMGAVSKAHARHLSTTDRLTAALEKMAAEFDAESRS